MEKASNNIVKQQDREMVGKTKKTDSDQIKPVDIENKKQITYTTALRKSGLKWELEHETSKKAGNRWYIVKDVWQKAMHPEETTYSTSNLIDAYLAQKYKNGYRSYNGCNPLKSLEKEKFLSNLKINTLINMYKSVKYLESIKNILHSPSYKVFKFSVDVDAMAKLIENIEADYKKSFFKYFWTEERKHRFTEALKNIDANFNENEKLPDNIYTSIMDEVFSGKNKN